MYRNNLFKKLYFANKVFSRVELINVNNIKNLISTISVNCVIILKMGKAKLVNYNNEQDQLSYRAKLIYQI